MKKDQELTALSDKTASLPSRASGSGGDDAEFEGVSTGLQRLSTREDLNEAKDALIKSLTEELVETKAELARAIKERQYFQVCHEHVLLQCYAGLTLCYYQSHCNTEESAVGDNRGSKDSVSSVFIN